MMLKKELSQPIFIAAEIGINHNGDMQLAKDMIKAAKAAGVNGVKFQNYYTEDFILDKNLTYRYESRDKIVEETQFEMFKRYELSKENLRFLKNVCDEEDLVFFSTPTSIRGIQELEELDVSLYKNGSDLLVNLNMIQEFAKTSKKTVISTGMATLGEIDEAVRAYEEAGGKDLIILHCTSSYPTPASEVNLRRIPALQQAFKYPIGFSDHTEGIAAAIGAASFGAVFIEKHFTIDKDLPGPDHSFSSDENEMRELVEGVRTLEQNLGTSKIGPTKSEEIGRVNYRLSCVANKKMKAGQVITKQDISFSRPATGLPPKFAEQLVGRTLKKDLGISDIFEFDSLC